MTLAAIKRHASQHLAGRGKITVSNAVKGAYRITEAAVILDTPEQREIYHIWADQHAVAMHKARTEPLPELPLFAALHAEEGGK